MTRNPCARTNATLRREIQESSETNKALAAKTVAKWRSRATTSDARKGPRRPVSTVLSATEEALIVVFRKHTRPPLDVCLAHLKPRIPALSRSALHRCLKRYRVSRIPRGLAEKPPKFDLGRQSAHFTIEVCAMPGEADDYLYAAISQTRFVFAKVMKGVGPSVRLFACASKSVRSPIADLRGRPALRTFSRTSLQPFITIIRAELFDFSTMRPIWLARQALRTSVYALGKAQAPPLWTLKKAVAAISGMLFPIP